MNLDTEPNFEFRSAMRLALAAVEAAEEVVRLTKLRELRGDFFCSKEKLEQAQERFDELARRAKEAAK